MFFAQKTKNHTFRGFLSVFLYFKFAIRFCKYRSCKIILNRTHKRKTMVMENTLIAIGGRQKVMAEDVVVLVADSNYSLLYMADGKVIHVATTLRILEERLTNHSFFRSHRSYLINIKHVSNFDRERHLFIQMKNNMVACLARKKREIFKSEIACLLNHNKHNLPIKSY